jgi:hypothetical protein
MKITGYDFSNILLEAGEYVKLPIGDLGLMESRIFPGLVLSVDNMLKGNLAEVLGILQAEIDSERHRSYCQQLGALGDEIWGIE